MDSTAPSNFEIRMQCVTSLQVLTRKFLRTLTLWPSIIQLNLIFSQHVGMLLVFLEIILWYQFKKKHKCMCACLNTYTFSCIVFEPFPHLYNGFIKPKVFAPSLNLPLTPALCFISLSLGCLALERNIFSQDYRKLSLCRWTFQS